ncbi:non-ribosomal peptide synthetase [Xenorhabdus bovienii]|uniref:non-ribosomal peptide synthetase n=1 Tax=Xenorhabdus bovienii TaxID=40576 RepID=UPI0023B218B6|nr:non-ribosomal peptide synthetase [Xenorhabdus bovienii]
MINEVEELNKIQKKEHFWRGFINNCKHPEFSNYFTKSNDNSGVDKIYLSSEISKNLLSIANGSDKRLSALLISLIGFIQSTMLRTNESVILTTSYHCEDESAGMLCVPVKLIYEQTLIDLIKSTSKSIQDVLPYGVNSFTSIFEGAVQFTSAVILKNCQSVNKEIEDFSCSQLIFEHDGENIFCEIHSPYDVNYNNEIIKMVELLVRQIRSENPLSSLKLSEPSHIDIDKTVSEIESGSTIPALFMKRVKMHPTRIAVTDAHASFSYAELDELSHLFAFEMLKQGVAKNDTVGIHMKRSCSAIIVMLAVLKIGAKYCPFDVNWPIKRKIYVKDTAAIKYLVVSHDTACELSDCNSIIYGSTDSTTNTSLDAEFNDAEAGDSAYVIFTSGSTGNPKGVEVSHGAVINLVQGLHERVYKNYQGSLNVSMISALSFDASVQQLYPSLLLGHTLHIVPDDMRRDGRKVVEFWNENNIHIADCTPTHLRMIHTQFNEQAICCSVNHLMIGGELLEKHNWHNFAKCWQSVPNASNAYGPTECCVQSTSFEFNDSRQIHTTTIPIGFPMPGEKVVLIDDFLRILPEGAIGEIAIAGQGLAKGYINNPELTAQKFVLIDGERYYRTGDLAQYVGDVGLVYLGRLDNQVKINGYRIELGEIEIAIQQVMTELSSTNQFDAKPICDVFVTVNSQDSDNKFLVAYLYSNIEFISDDIKSALAERLPDYMVPAYFIQLEEFPQNSSGKIDIARLPDPSNFIVNKRVIPCSNETEEKILGLWSEILNTKKENISSCDNFFDLGGSSFKLVQLSLSLGELFNKEIEVVDLFQYTTIKQQAELIDGNGETDNIVISEDHSVEQFDEALKMFGN